MIQMKTFRSSVALLLATGSLTAAVLADAAPREAGIYQEEVAVCAHIQQDRAACIREAGAARQEARRGGLTGAPDYLANALARCAPQPPAERMACEQRVRGTGTTSIDGSVLGGGVIRETVTPVSPYSTR
jgi:hypothetical protein